MLITEKTTPTNGACTVFCGREKSWSPPQNKGTCVWGCSSIEVAQDSVLLKANKCWKTTHFSLLKNSSVSCPVYSYTLQARKSNGQTKTRQEPRWFAIMKQYWHALWDHSNTFERSFTSWWIIDGLSEGMKDEKKTRHWQRSISGPLWT